LSYSIDGESKKQVINLIEIPSNLGNGFYYNFVCPITDKRCYKLYLINGLFGHRTAFGAIYRNQKLSKSWRRLASFWDNDEKRDQLEQEVFRKHSKTHYKGKYTKKCLRLLKLAKKDKAMYNGAMSVLESQKQ